MTLSNDVYTELFIDDTWVDISTYVQVRDNSGEVGIKRGRSNEASNIEPSKCDFELNNRDGRFSPRNPLSPYFGLLGRNTPVRVGLRNTEIIDSFGRTEVASWGEADNDVSYDLSGAGGSVLASDFSVSSGQGVMSVPQTSAYRMSILADAGPSPSIHQSYLDVSVAVTFNLIPSDITGGALEPANIMLRGQNYTDCYLLRAQVETNESVTLAIRRETAGTVIAGPVTVSGLTYAPGTAIRVRFEARGTTLRARAWNAANTEPTTWDISTTSSLITKSGYIGIRSGVSSGNSNTKPILFKYDNLEMTVFRITGEISTFPQKWDLTGDDAWVPIEASGILQRLNQGNKQTNPGLKEYLKSTTSLGYWPLDDKSEATQGVNLVEPNNKFNRSNDTVATGSTSFGSGNLGATMDPGLSVSYTGANLGYMYGYAHGSASQTAIALDFLYKADQLGDPTFSIFTRRSDTGAIDAWKMELEGNNTGNDVFISALFDILPDSSSAVGLNSSAVLPAITDGLLHHVRFQLEQNGGNVDYEVWIDGVSVVTGSTARTLGSVDYVSFVYPQNSAQTALAIGHMIVYENGNIPAIADNYEVASAHLGEVAGTRFARLCEENNVASVVLGTETDSIAMGPQYPGSFTGLLAEIEATDKGQLFEYRDLLAMAYRLRTDLYNQDAVVTIDYSAGELGKALEPVDDDQNTRNDIFAQRKEGSSYNATKETGPLSVLEPPLGVGRYKDEKEVNVEFDNQLADQAGWSLSLGTVDEARYPNIVVNLHNPNVQANPTLLTALLKANIGDRIDITNLFSINIYDTVSAIILGYKEVFNKFKHTITFNCAPYSPYEVMVWGTDASTGDWRWDTYESTLTSDINDGVGSMSVTSVAGEGTPLTLWTTDAASFPFDIYVGGERMTVTNITSTTSPQTFTVTRSVNGVQKSHSAGTAVRLWKTPRYAL